MNALATSTRTYARVRVEGFELDNLYPSQYHGVAYAVFRGHKALMDARTPGELTFLTPELRRHTLEQWAALAAESSPPRQEHLS